MEDDKGGDTDPALKAPMLFAQCHGHLMEGTRPDSELGCSKMVTSTMDSGGRTAWGTEGLAPGKKGKSLCKGPGAGEPQGCAGLAAFSHLAGHREASFAYHGGHVALQTPTPRVPTGKPLICFYSHPLSKPRKNSLEEPVHDESRDFPDRAAMFGLAENHKALVSQLPGSLCAEGLAQHYSGMIKQEEKEEEGLFLSLHTNKYLLEHEVANL